MNVVVVVDAPGSLITIDLEISKTGSHGTSEVQVVFGSKKKRITR